ncbi:hypothetical protein [Tenacibaculum sp.]|uniref:hypothetical protein n=1 Tax=Tenacibaculum sp. TaxID=1906242 RepID=UPI003D0DC33B
MTLKFVKRNVYFLSILGFLTLTSCDSNETSDLLNADLTTEESLNVVLEDDISSNLESVIEDDAAIGEIAAKGEASISNHPECILRTVEETAEGKTVTIDFGDGCTGKRGHVFVGKIIIEYVKVEGAYSKTVTFENFSIDENSVVGTISVSRVRENASGNPERTYSIDLTITLATGEVIIKKGEKIKEMIEGAGTVERGDDVFLISGFWESVNKLGKEAKVTITTSLRREYVCRYIVSGVVEITRGEHKHTIDFGDGSCDNVATVTDTEGNVREITLKDRR